MPLRVSEKEAIERGWIDPPSLDYTNQSTGSSHRRLTREEQAPHETGAGPLLVFIAGWLVGFVMALMF